MLQAVFVPEVMELVGRIREGRLRMELMQADDDLLNEMETYAIDRSLQLFSMPDAMAPQEDKFAHRQYPGYLVGRYEMMLNQVRSKPPTVLRAVDIIRLYTTLVDHNVMDPEPIAPVRGDNPHRYVRRDFAHEVLQRAQRALEEPCRAYHYSINNAGIEPLLAIAALAVDYWEIIPFSAFNRRTLSLLIQQQLLQHGYSVFRYISFEPLFLNDDLFYSAMRASTLDWIHCRNDYLPFTLFFLRIAPRSTALAHRSANHKTGWLLSPVLGVPGAALQTMSARSRIRIRGYILSVARAARVAFIAKVLS